MGYWTIKYRTLETFVILALQVYKNLMLLCIGAMLSREIIHIFWENKVIIWGISIGFVLTSVIVVAKAWNKKNMKIEFLNGGKRKKSLLICLLSIFLMSYFFSGIQEKSSYIYTAIWLVLLTVWMIVLLRDAEVGVILDKQYANIYIKDSEKVVNVSAGSIKKKGEWIIVGLDMVLDKNMLL